MVLQGLLFTSWVTLGLITELHFSHLENGDLAWLPNPCNSIPTKKNVSHQMWLYSEKARVVDTCKVVLIVLTFPFFEHWPHSRTCVCIIILSHHHWCGMNVTYSSFLRWGNWCSEFKKLAHDEPVKPRGNPDPSCHKGVLSLFALIRVAWEGGGRGRVEI